MVALVTAITVALSIVIAAFVSFSPNLQRLMENDFMGRVNSNAYLNGLQRGQLGVRAGTLTSTSNEIDLNTNLRERNGTVQNTLHTDVRLNGDQIVVNLCLDETTDCP